jgi:RNA recognition motif-containing protein
MKERKVRKTSKPQTGSSPKTTKIGCQLGANIGLGHNTYSSVKVAWWEEVEIPEGMTKEQAKALLIESAKSSLEEISNDQLAYWRKELGIEE